MSEYIPTIGFIGLISSGKSTIINSLVGKRFLETGILKTTSQITLIGYDNILNLSEKYYKQFKLKSDDEYKFNIIDFPGISTNIEDNNSIIDIMNKYLIECDIILWCSDIDTLITTQYEIDQINKINKYLITNNSYYQFGIIYNKCNTDILDIKKNLDIDNKYNTIYFNAFNRILNQKYNCSKYLKNLVIKSNSNISIFNSEFNIKSFIDNIIRRYNEIDNNKYYEYLESQINNNYNNIKLIYNKIYNIINNIDNHNTSYINPEINATQFNLKKQIINILDSKFTISNRCFFHKDIIIIYKKVLNEIISHNDIIKIDKTKYFNAFEISYIIYNKFDNIRTFCVYENSRIELYMQLYKKLKELQKIKDHYTSLLKKPKIQFKKYIINKLDDSIIKLDDLIDKNKNNICIHNDFASSYCATHFTENIKITNEFNDITKIILDIIKILKNNTFIEYYNKINIIIKFYIDLANIFDYDDNKYNNVLEFLKNTPNFICSYWIVVKNSKNYAHPSSGQNGSHRTLGNYLLALVRYFCPLVKIFSNKLNTMKLI